jgi:hypothetical protein
MLKEELKQIDSSEKSVRKTGLTVGVVLILISFILWWLEKNSFMYFSIAGGLFIILSYIAVAVLKPFHKVWIGFSLILGFVMSRIILSVLFFLVVTPIGLIAKLVGKKFMPLGFDKNATTYWEKREKTVKEKVDYERQF